MREHVVAIERLDARAQRVACRDRLGALPRLFRRLIEVPLTARDGGLRRPRALSEPRQDRGVGRAEGGPALAEPRQLRAGGGQVADVGDPFDGVTEADFAAAAIFLGRPPALLGGSRFPESRPGRGG